MMLRRIWLHVLSRVAEVQAERALRRSAFELAKHGFFSARKDGFVQRLRGQS